MKRKEFRIGEIMKITIIVFIGVALISTGIYWCIEFNKKLNRDMQRLKVEDTTSNEPEKPPIEAVAQQTDTLWRVTAYCPCEKCCGRFADGITASGVPAVGRIIAAPPDIPFGTEIFIEGYGYAKVQDRGGAIKGKRLDVLFPSHQQALNWGVHYLRIEL